MSVSIFPLAGIRVLKGGSPIVAAYGPVVGGFIQNPYTAAAQGVATAEPIFVSVVGDASLGPNATTIAIEPGQFFFFPENLTTNVSVTAATTGHLIAGGIFQPPVQYPPTSTAGTFPPASPTSITKTIPSYLYQQYFDDDNLQAFVAAYNALTQEYVDEFNAINLPIYTGPVVAGALLDWVAEGLYGIKRPVLSSGLNRDVGPYNTAEFNTLEFNGSESIGPQDVYITNDDIFRRIITWHFYKGDGKVFNIRWLKRRIMRFLLGTDGISYNVDQTYQVSVSFGVGNQVNITLINGIRTFVSGARYNEAMFNTFEYNQANTSYSPITPLPNAAVFKEAVDSGVLELPFQFTYEVVI